MAALSQRAKGRAWIAFAALLAAFGLAPLGLQAQEDMFATPDPGPPLTPLELGIKVYRHDFANCQLCHSWSGEGGGPLMMDGRDLDGGPPLTTSKMTREEMVEIIACGRLPKFANSVMPAYLEDAWTPKYPCYGGKTAADVPDVERPPLFEPYLYLEEIEAVVTFIQTVYQASAGAPGMNLEFCMMYFGPESRGCDRFR